MARWRRSRTRSASRGRCSNSSPTSATASNSIIPTRRPGSRPISTNRRRRRRRSRPQLPRYFGRLPKTALLIKPVEPFREKSAGKAFYNDPPPDGSRPGTYYVNLYDMKNMPSIEVEVLFCHEGIPGHHLQGALLSELAKGEVPPFRQFSGYTATDEGWGLYAEKLCKEMGLYQDPYRDFGRLQLELHRAIRLVVDSGIHHKRWTREQAIKYVEDNSADAKGGIVKAIERYIVYPGPGDRLHGRQAEDRGAARQGQGASSAPNMTTAASTTPCCSPDRCRSACSRCGSTSGLRG